jgi:hypothetical protein
MECASVTLVHSTKGSLMSYATCGTSWPVCLLCPGVGLVTPAGKAVLPTLRLPVGGERRRPLPWEATVRLRDQQARAW